MDVYNPCSTQHNWKTFLNGYVAITISFTHHFPPWRTHQHLLAVPSGAPAWRISTTYHEGAKRWENCLRFSITPQNGCFVLAQTPWDFEQQQMSRRFFNMNSIINSELYKWSKHNEATNAPKWICTFQIPGMFTVLLFHCSYSNHWHPYYGPPSHSFLMHCIGSLNYIHTHTYFNKYSTVLCKLIIWILYCFSRVVKLKWV